MPRKETGYDDRLRRNDHCSRFLFALLAWRYLEGKRTKDKGE
jgi:hypothetical protein